MDLQLSDDELEIVEAIRRYVTPQPAPPDAAQASRDVLKRLDAAGYLDMVEPSSALFGVLLAEEAGAALVQAPVAERGLVAPLSGLGQISLRLGLIFGTSSGVRWGSECEEYVAIRDESVILCSESDVDVRALGRERSTPMALVTVIGGERLDHALAETLLSAWELAIAAEINGVIRSVIRKTVDHVSTRVQFGRPIGSFQAVQHRLATLAVHAESSLWLTRRAALCPGDKYLSSCAATYACESALGACTVTHQATGAIGLSSEYGLEPYTSRLRLLATLMGGHAYHSTRVSTLRDQLYTPQRSTVAIGER